MTHIEEKHMKEIAVARINISIYEHVLREYKLHNRKDRKEQTIEIDNDKVKVKKEKSIYKFEITQTERKRMFKVVGYDRGEVEYKNKVSTAKCLDLYPEKIGIEKDYIVGKKLIDHDVTIELYQSFCKRLEQEQSRNLQDILSELYFYDFLDKESEAFPLEIDSEKIKQIKNSYENGELLKDLTLRRLLFYINNNQSMENYPNFDIEIKELTEILRNFDKTILSSASVDELKSLLKHLEPVLNLTKAYIITKDK